jgi:predicted transcriptional regulator
MTKLPTSISDAELEVLKVLWADGPSTVRAVHERLAHRQRRWAYTTVLTLLSRLREKGFVASEKSGVALEFRATVSREQLVRRRLTDLVQRVCDGTTGPLVHALVDGRPFSSEEVESFRQLLDRLELDREQT